MKNLEICFWEAHIIRSLTKIDWTVSRKAYVPQLCMVAQVYTATAHTFFL